MKPITFELTTVTPVFMAGEDGTSIELRPPILDYLAHGTYDFKTKTFNREYLKQEEQFVDKKDTVSFSERHARPYFLKVVKTADGAFDGYILYLPSEYSKGVPQKGDEEEHTKKFLKYCDEFNNHFAAYMGGIMAESDIPFSE